jgi:hypothetical protein
MAGLGVAGGWLIENLEKHRAARTRMTNGNARLTTA